MRVHRIYLDELKEEQINNERRRNEVFAPLRGAQLRDYVNSIRSTLYNERLREKKERYNETVLKYVPSSSVMLPAVHLTFACPYFRCLQSKRAQGQIIRGKNESLGWRAGRGRRLNDDVSNFYPCARCCMRLPVYRSHSINSVFMYIYLYKSKYFWRRLDECEPVKPGYNGDRLLPASYDEMMMTTR